MDKVGMVHGSEVSRDCGIGHTLEIRQPRELKGIGVMSKQSILLKNPLFPDNCLFPGDRNTSTFTF